MELQIRTGTSARAESEPLSFRISRRSDNGGSTRLPVRILIKNTIGTSRRPWNVIFNITPDEKKRRISPSFCANEFSQFSRYFWFSSALIQLIRLDSLFLVRTTAIVYIASPELFVEIGAKYFSRGASLRSLMCNDKSLAANLRSSSGNSSFSRVMSSFAPRRNLGGNESRAILSARRGFIRWNFQGCKGTRERGNEVFPGRTSSAHEFSALF